MTSNIEFMMHMRLVQHCIKRRRLSASAVNMPGRALILNCALRTHMVYLLTILKNTFKEIFERKDIRWRKSELELLDMGTSDVELNLRWNAMRIWN